jgi:hypothetical protein
MAFIYIKQAGVSSSFAKLETRPGDAISDLAERACSKFPSWRADATLSLYLVAQGGGGMPSALAEATARHLDQIDWPLERAGISSGAWLVARVAAPSMTPAPAVKNFSLLVTGVDVWSEVVPVRIEVALSTEKELRDLLNDNGGGNLVVVGAAARVQRVEDIVCGETYTLIGGRQRAYLDRQQWTQQADRMLEEVSTLAVREACVTTMGELRMLLDTTLTNSKGQTRQFDGLLLSTAAAIAVEAKHVAVEEHIATVLSGAAFLRELALEGHDARFKGIADVLPVLAASRFSEAMVALCEKRGIGTVRPNGLGYYAYTPPPLQWPPQLGQRSIHTFSGRRGIHTLARVVLRALL